MTDDPSYSPWCGVAVDRPVMRNDWSTLTFLHWRYDVAVVQRLLPPGLTVETFDGDAWVALVPFAMRVASPGNRAVPWFSMFLETNVRTYVRGPDGTTGVWFFSLETTRLHIAVVARATYRVPYCWAHMRLEHDDHTVVYRSRRRWPGPRGARSTVVVDVGEPYAAHELTALDHFLTARYALYARRPGGGLLHTRADHQPWTLRHADALHIDDELVAACGLPAPVGPPASVLHADTIHVKLGGPRRVPGSVLATEVVVGRGDGGQRRVM
jgi:uncharacterized protein YqjF (DUF2071 family)